MAEYTIDKIEYNGNVYKLQDNISGYSTTDEKVKTEGITTGTNYYLIMGPHNTSSATTKNIDATDLVYNRGSSTGAILRVGNGGSKGFLRLGSPTANA